MGLVGKAKVDKKTKNLVHRLEKDDIAIISHTDLDEISAKEIIEKKVKAVINTRKSITGKYFNTGPEILLNNNIDIYDYEGEEILSEITEEEVIRIDGNYLKLQNGKRYPLYPITKQCIQEKLNQSYENKKKEFIHFVDNTISFLQKEKENLFKGTLPKSIESELKNKEAVIVVRGKNYKEDLRAIKSYIFVKKPILIGIDGGADALIQENLEVDFLFGDMDSVSEKGLKKAKKIIIHTYLNGECPGLERIRKENLQYELFNGYGTSEDAAMLMAYFAGAKKIVIVGSHSNMVDFLCKDRKGMASTLLTRMMIGEKLIDVKGINEILKEVL